MATSLTSLTQLPCEDICWKILELSLLTQIVWYLQSLIDSRQWFSSRLMEEVALKGFWGHSPHPISAGVSCGSSHTWNLSTHQEWVSKVTTHHLFYRFYFVVLFFMNYDYRTFTLDIQNDNPSQYYRGFLRLFFFLWQLLY